MTERREFLRQASLLAAGSVAASSLAAQGAPATSVQGTWDMAWLERVNGQFKMAFDAPEISDGVCLHQARSFLAGYDTVHGLKDNDLTAVLVIRHKAIPMVLGDELWSDGYWGDQEKLKDPATGETTKRNPFIKVPAGAQHSLTWPDGALDTLMSRGVIVLACDLALRNAAGQIASRRKIPRQDALQLVSQHLIRGVYRMPSGIFATCRAQAAGCGVLHSV